MEKKLFIVDGFRIWATDYQDALNQYQMIIKF